MSRPLAPSTSNSNPAALQRIVNWAADRVGITGSADHGSSNNNNGKMLGVDNAQKQSKSKVNVPAMTPVTSNVRPEEFVRTRDAFITALTGLTSSLDKFVKAYLEHSEAVIDNGGVLDISPAFAPLGRLIPGGIPGAPFAQSGFTAVNDADALVADDLELDADGKKKKRKRNTKPRDPNAPKRPMTAYFRFMQEQRPLLNEQFKSEPVGEDGVKRDVNKLATERWKELTDAEREHYHAEYRKDRLDYEEAMKALGLPVGKADMHDGEAEHAEDAIIAATIPVAAAPAAAANEPSSDEEEVPPAPVVTKGKAAKASNPEPAKKTPRQTKKKATKDTAEVPTPQFSSINPTKAAAAAPAASDAEVAASSPARKRKAAKTDTDTAPKKRGRKSNADKVAEAEAEADAAAASAQLEVEQPAPESAKGKKDKKKKRKSEAAE